LYRQNERRFYIRLAKRVLPDMGTKHTCHCGRTFAHKRDLDRHETAVHRKEKPFQCQRCDDSFSRKDNLKRHKASGHCSSRAPRQFECTAPGCKLRFTRERYRQIHSRKCLKRYNKGTFIVFFIFYIHMMLTNRYRKASGRRK